MSDIYFNNSENTFEIHSESLNESLIEDILLNMSNQIEILDKDALPLLVHLSKVFWGNDHNSCFVFSGFLIDETTTRLDIDFRMSYHNSGDEFSDYANWYIDVKDFRIMGCFRQQL